MSGGYALEFSDLLIAMKQALLAQTALPYLNDCRIYNGPWYLGPWSNYSVYLRPMGSPEVVMAEDGGAGVTKHAIHEVAIEACMSISNPSDEDSVIGRTGARIGITTFVSHLCEFLENNTLGLANNQLEHGAPPTCEFPGNAYGVVEADTDIWLQVARGIYRAQTRSFYRTGTYS